MRVQRIVRDVSGDAYRVLLKTALAEADQFSLAWRDQLQFDASANALRHRLRSFQVRHLKTDRWPGTVLIGHKASVITY
jgi:hypothetical protein